MLRLRVRGSARPRTDCQRVDTSCEVIRLPLVGGLAVDSKPAATGEETKDKGDGKDRSADGAHLSSADSSTLLDGLTIAWTLTNSF